MKMSLAQAAHANLVEQRVEAMNFHLLDLNARELTDALVELIRVRVHDSIACETFTEITQIDELLAKINNAVKYNI